MLSALNEHKDRWYIVWPSYAGIFGPMALYVFHDVIDARWRRRGPRILWFTAYLAANALFFPAFAVYFAAQVGGDDRDHKEAAGALVAIAVNFIAVRKIVRGLMAFETTAVLAQRFALARNRQPCVGGPFPRAETAGILQPRVNAETRSPAAQVGQRVSAWLTECALAPVRATAGMAFWPLRLARGCCLLFDKHAGMGQVREYREYVGGLVQMNASCLLDDDVPGDGARVAWLPLIGRMLWRWLWCKLQLHRLACTARSFQNTSVLQDANDLIIMTTAWVWACLAQACLRGTALLPHGRNIRGQSPAVAATTVRPIVIAFSRQLRAPSFPAHHH